MFLFQKWFGSSSPEDVWAWWLLIQLQFTPCEALSSVWIGFAWPYSQACCHPCYLCTFSYPISSLQSTAFNMLWYSTLWTAPLSVMTLCDLLSLWRVSMIVFWTIAESAVFPIIVFSQRYPQFILYGWSFWDTDFLLSLVVSSNHQNKKNKKLCFTLHVMNLKYMKVSLCEISYKKKKYFSLYSTFLICTCKYYV